MQLLKYRMQTWRIGEQVAPHVDFGTLLKYVCMLQHQSKAIRAKPIDHNSASRTWTLSY